MKKIVCESEKKMSRKVFRSCGLLLAAALAVEVSTAEVPKTITVGAAGADFTTIQAAVNGPRDLISWLTRTTDRPAHVRSENLGPGVEYRASLRSSHPNRI